MKPLKKIVKDSDVPPNGRAMATDPLSEEVILEQFYRPSSTPAGASRAERGEMLRAGLAGEDARSKEDNKKPKPTHYKIVCISLYNEDIERLEQLVAELKRRGHTKANKSQVIRAALDQIDLDKIPKGY